MLFPVIMFGCESWNIKKTEHQKTDSFNQKTLESPLDCKKIQPVHPKGDQSWDGHNFPFKEQVSFNFTAAVTICSDFGAQKNKV